VQIAGDIEVFDDEVPIVANSRSEQCFAIAFMPEVGEREGARRAEIADATVSKR